MAELIHNQRRIPKEQYRYGLRSSAATGCGWIAIANALALLGYTTRREALIRYLTWQLPLIHGNLGTSFWAPVVCLRKWGFPVKTVYRPRHYDAEAKAADACILFYHWRQKGRCGAHFVALHHTPKGFVGYNTYRDSDGPNLYGESLEEFLRKKGYFATVLITIRKPTASP